MAEKRDYYEVLEAKPLPIRKLNRHIVNWPRNIIRI